MAAAPADPRCVDWSVLARVSDEVGSERASLVLEAFAREIRQQIDGIDVDLDRGALAAVAGRAHRLKGTCGTIGARELELAVRRLEEAVKRLDHPGIRAAASALPALARDALREIERFRRRAPA
jgi:HPt (histidine-containing phosphotransfer) domain-containing protein